MVQVQIQGEYAMSINHDIAREIMGRNFFGIEEAIQYFGISPTPEQLDDLSKIPFSEETLREASETHILVAVFPLSIMEIRRRVDSMFHEGSNKPWYSQEEFAQERGRAGWQLILKTPVGGSAHKYLYDQQGLVSGEDRIPTIQEMVYTVVGHRLANGEKLFEDFSVRTVSLDSGKRNVNIGHRNSGVYIYGCFAAHCYRNLGISSARKPEPLKA
jgi:YD repeat-containing protein